MAGLKVFVDLISQPSRAVLLFVKQTQIPHEKVIVSIGKGQHKAPEYVANIHRFGSVPAISDNGFNLIESVAILKYLSRKYNVPDHWYPKDLQQQARVDEYLDWQHIGARIPLATYFFQKYLLPMRTGQTASESVLEDKKKKMEGALWNIENIWLKDSPYLVGDKISIADLLGITEVEQTLMAGFDPSEGRPKIASWLQRVRKDLYPHYDEVHVIMNKIIEKNKSKDSKL